MVTPTQVVQVAVDSIQVDTLIQVVGLLAAPHIIVETIRPYKVDLLVESLIRRLVRIMLIVDQLVVHHTTVQVVHRTIEMRIVTVDQVAVLLVIIAGIPVHPTGVIRDPIGVIQDLIGDLQEDIVDLVLGVEV